MESRELYKACEHLGTTLTWEKDWIHFGTANEIKYDIIEDLINNFLQGGEINLVHERTNCGTFETTKILSAIKDLIGKSNFELWNDSLERAIQFNRIGVLLKGEKTPYKKR